MPAPPTRPRLWVLHGKPWCHWVLVRGAPSHRGSLVTSGGKPPAASTFLAPGLIKLRRNFALRITRNVKHKKEKAVETHGDCPQSVDDAAVEGACTKHSGSLDMRLVRGGERLSRLATLLRGTAVALGVRCFTKATLQALHTGRSLLHGRYAAVRGRLHAKRPLKDRCLMAAPSAATKSPSAAHSSKDSSPEEGGRSSSLSGPSSDDVVSSDVVSWTMPLRVTSGAKFPRRMSLYILAILRRGADSSSRE